MNKKSKTKGLIKSDIGMIISILVAPIMFFSIMLISSKAVANPTQDFVFQLCHGPRCDVYYEQKDGEIILSKLQTNKATKAGESKNISESELIYYDTSEQSAQPITLEEVNRLNLDDSKLSSDGYYLSKLIPDDRQYISDSTDNSFILRKGIFSKKLDFYHEYLSENSTYKIIGWVK